MRKAQINKFLDEFRANEARGLFEVEAELFRKRVELCVRDEDGDLDFDMTEALVAKFLARFPGWGGYRMGWGVWNLEEGYRSSGSDFDYCNPASPIHY